MVDVARGNVFSALWNGGDGVIDTGLGMLKTAPIVAGVTGLGTGLGALAAYKRKRTNP